MDKRTLYDWAKTLDLDIRDYFVLKAMIDLANAKSLEVWSRVDKLADEARCSERRAQYALETLRSCKLICGTGRFHRTARGGRVPIYRFSATLSLRPGVEGAKIAPQTSSVHPVGRSCVHPQMRSTENKLSKDNGGALYASSDLPHELVRQFIARFGPEDYGRYLKPARWDEANRSIVPFSNVARKWLKAEAGALLNKWNLAVADDLAAHV